jgi:hypothetical protein
MKKRILLVVLSISTMQFLYCQDTPDDHFTNRIGMTTGVGAGFTNVQIAELNNGTMASISFGAGTVVIIEYGHRFGQHFDLAINVGGQFSNLDKDVNNGSMKFIRNNLALTASYVLPLSGNDKSRFRFGAGLDLLYASVLDFDLSQVEGGTKDIWEYNTTLGEHILITYEADLSKRFSLNTGLKLMNVKYSFKSGGNSYPIEEELAKPNGSGINFLIGLTYNFGRRK